MLHNLFLNICSILIQPQNYRIPPLIYQICIILYFLQAFSNLLHLNFDSNWLLTIMATISKSTTLIHFVEDQNSEFLYWSLYIIIHLILYSFFLCVIILPNNRINKIGKLFQNFIVFFPLILQDIFIEFNLVLIIEIGWHTLIGIIGLLSTAFMGVLSCYFSQPYEFAHNDLLRRKMSLIILCINIKLSIILVSSYEVDIIATIALYQIFSLLSLIDAFYIHPFPNIQIAKTYIWCAGFFGGLGIQATLYIYEILSPDNIIVIMVGLSPLLSYACLTIYERQEFKYLQNLLTEDFWIFSQMLMDQHNKFKMYVALRSHINNCSTTYCYCQKYWEIGNTKITRDHNIQINHRMITELNLSSQDIIYLMDSMFQKALIHCSKQLLIEFYYVSFLEKFQNNDLLGYFCLKRMSQNKETYPIFYQIMFEVMSNVKVYHNQKLEDQILNSIKLKRKQLQVEQPILNVEEIVKISKFIHKCKKCLLNVLTQKLTIWTLLQKGNDSIDCLIKNLIRPLNRFLNSKDEMDKLLGSLEQNQQNCAFLKLQLINQLIIQNQGVYDINKRIIELKQRDQYRDDLELNNFNFLQGQTVIIRSGIAQTLGKILNRENDKIATFFGYNVQEMQQIQSINDLMPKHVAVMHNYILFQYLNKGTSPLLYSTRQIFLKNKDQFLFSVAITLRNDFMDMNDCVYNVNLLKLVQKELIMFDVNGSIIGMSNELFQILSNNSTYFSYNELLRSGFIQIFMPKIVNIMKNLEENTLHNNLSCSIQSNEFSLKYCHNYFTQNTGTTHLLTNLQSSQQLIQTQEKEIQNINYKLKFQLHTSKLDFNNVDLGILNIIGKQIPSGVSLQYFVIEITEMEAHTKRYQSVTNTSKLTSNRTSIDYDKDLEVLDEERRPLHYNYDKLIVSPRFQIDSPRMNLETPKETERGLIIDKDNRGFFGQIFQRFQINRQGLENNPKYISKNAMQEEGIPESLNDIDIVPQKEIQKIRIKKKHKTQKSNKEQLSYLSSNSKASYNNLEEIQYMAMPQSQKLFSRLKVLFLLFFVASVLTQILISQSGLAQIAEISQHLIIPYYFNLNYINYCQSAIYNSIQVQNKFEIVMNESIERQFILLYQEAYSYISYQDQKITTQIFRNASDYQNVSQGLYEYQVTVQTLYIENSSLSLINLLGRFEGNLNFTDHISEIQISKIYEETNLIIQYSQLLAFIFMGLFFLPVLPTIQSINNINHFLEKIVLLVARVTLDESSKEMMRLKLLADYISETQGLDLITKELPNLERAQQTNQKVKSQYLQSRIYNQRLSCFFYVGSISIEIIVCIIFLIGALLYLDQIPDQFMQNAQQFVAQSHHYQALQQRNLVIEMINNNLTIQEKSQFIENHEDILSIYDSLSIPLTNSILDFFEQINFNNLCVNQSCEYEEYYDKGLSNVLSQIKILFQNNDGKYDSLAYQALIVNFPSFISPFITQIQEKLSDILYNDIIQLSSGFLYYLVFGGLALLIMISIWIYLVNQCKYS